MVPWSLAKAAKPGACAAGAGPDGLDTLSEAALMKTSAFCWTGGTAVENRTTEGTGAEPDAPSEAEDPPRRERCLSALYRAGAAGTVSCLSLSGAAKSN